MSACDGENEDFLSDEDMFSPKKRQPESNTAIRNTQPQPRCKDRHVAVFKKLLTGIPPPPDYTNPDFHLDKMLSSWLENQSLVWDGGGANKRLESSEEGLSIFGFCHNVDTSCEEFELLGSQVCERYISCETASLTSNVYVKMTQSAKKRRKANGWSQSPRTRVSYLTRRANTFQKDNIAAAVATASRKTQILVSKEGSRKRTTAEKNVPVLKGKRALFLSPENSNKFRTPEEGKNRRLCRQLNLQPSPEKNDHCLNQNGTCGHSSHTRSSERKRCSRSLFIDKQTNNNESKGDKEKSNLEKTNYQQNQLNLLSTPHRKKMLWAVSYALKEVKISMEDAEFKSKLSRLYKATVHHWKTNNQNQGVSSDKKRVSTSDAMLAAARDLVELVTDRPLPKSVSKSKTPIKCRSDENNPPSSVESSDANNSILRLSGELGTFPLEPVGVLVENSGLSIENSNLSVTPKNSFAPRLNSKLNSVIEETPNMVKLGEKRKRLDGNSEIVDESLTPSKRLLRKTPSKITPSKNVTFNVNKDCQEDDECDERYRKSQSANRKPSRRASEEPTPKKRKSNSTRFEEKDQTLPRVLRNNTPSKFAVDDECKKFNAGTSKKTGLGGFSEEYSLPLNLKDRTPTKTPMRDRKRKSCTPKKDDIISPKKARTSKRVDVKDSDFEEPSPIKRVTRSRTGTPKKREVDDTIELLQVARKQTPSKSKVATPKKRVTDDTKDSIVLQCITRSRTPCKSNDRTPKRKDIEDACLEESSPVKKQTRSRAGTPKKWDADDNYVETQEVVSPKVAKKRTPKSNVVTPKMRVTRNGGSIEAQKVTRSQTPLNAVKPKKTDIEDSDVEQLSPVKKVVRSRTGTPKKWEPVDSDLQVAKKLTPSKSKVATPKKNIATDGDLVDTRRVTRSQTPCKSNTATPKKTDIEDSDVDQLSPVKKVVRSRTGTPKKWEPVDSDLQVAKKRTPSKSKVATPKKNITDGDLVETRRVTRSQTPCKSNTATPKKMETKDSNSEESSPVRKATTPKTGTPKKWELDDVHESPQLVKNRAPSKSKAATPKKRVASDDDCSKLQRVSRSQTPGKSSPKSLPTRSDVCTEELISPRVLRSKIRSYAEELTLSPKIKNVSKILTDDLALRLTPQKFKAGPSKICEETIETPYMDSFNSPSCLLKTRKQLLSPVSCVQSDSDSASNSSPLVEQMTKRTPNCRVPKSKKLILPVTHVDVHADRDVMPVLKPEGSLRRSNRQTVDGSQPPPTLESYRRNKDTEFSSSTTPKRRIEIDEDEDIGPPPSKRRCQHHSPDQNRLKKTSSSSDFDSTDDD